MKKLFLILTVMLMTSCVNKKLVEDCKNYKVIEKYRKKEKIIIQQYAGRIGSNDFYMPVSKIVDKYYIVFENGKTYSIKQEKYRTVKAGEKVEKCEF